MNGRRASKCRHAIGWRGPGPAAGRALGVALAAFLVSGGSGCSGDDSSTPAAGPTALPDASSASASSPDAARDATIAPPLLGDGGAPAASLSTQILDFGGVGCGAPPVTRTLDLANHGGSPLVVTASVTGASFQVSPPSLEVAPGGAGTLTVTATVPASAAAGSRASGALNLFTNDPAAPSATLPLAAVATGGSIALPLGTSPTIHFGTTAVGSAAPAAPVTLRNAGNAPATFTLGAISDSHFAFAGGAASATATLNAGESWTGSATFTPASALPATGTSTIAVSGTTCAGSVSSLVFTGQGAIGQISGWPTGTMDFGLADCGGPAPRTQSFTLRNDGVADARITAASVAGAPGFTTSAARGRVIKANGGILAITVSAPAVPGHAPLTPVSATLTVQTDADAAPHTIALTAQPHGAILEVDTAATPGFGDFGSVVLLQSASQRFAVKNTGNARANVTLATGAAPVGDGGAARSPFGVSVASAAVPAGTTLDESVTFAPVAASGASGSLAIGVDGPVCAALPAPLPLSGVGLGGGATVMPSSLAFGAPCGGAAPAAQSFSVTNTGSANLTWTMSAPTGPGASQYHVAAVPSPGLLAPGQSARVDVTALAVPSPAATVDAAAYAAQITIETDVPYDDPHAVALGEAPLGDQLAFSVPNLRFGQLPIASTLAQTFAVTSHAMAGSPAAALTFVVNGAGAPAYAVTPGTATHLAPGASSDAQTVTFAPPGAGGYPATLAITTSDALCTPLPAPIPLSGTGTQGKVYVSTTALAFGTDPDDPKGLVDCAQTGLARSFTISNTGDQSFRITGLALGLGAASPYDVSTGSALPITLPIQGVATVTITPKPIPAVVLDPNDPSPFTDALTITTDAALDTPHRVALAMQARGAVIADTPVATMWSFGTVGFGSIGTFTSVIRNDGNAPVAVELTGLAQPLVFGVRNNPTQVAANGVTSVVGQFTPPSSSGVWTDHGTLSVRALEALCAPLPAQWTQSAISLSGASSADGALTIAGDLAFPTTDCGSAPPAARAVTLASTANVAYPYTAKLASGAFYTITDAGTGALAAHGTASIVVTPKPVTPGPGVVPGGAPYADDLLLQIMTTPPTRFTVPIAWALNGAVLTLPYGAGPGADATGVPFYPADSTTGFALAMENAGTATATVSFAIQPADAFTLVPSGPVKVIPGIRALPELVSGSSAPACPAAVTGAATFLYAGPVCQPLPFTKVTVHSCAGTL